MAFKPLLYSTRKTNVNEGDILLKGTDMNAKAITSIFLTFCAL